MSRKKILEIDEITITVEPPRPPGQPYIFLKFSGKLNTDNIAPITNELRTLYEGGSQNTILDLSELEYVNSTGLSVLLNLWKQVNEGDKKLIFVRLHPFMDELFELTELRQKFTLADSLEEGEALLEK